MANHGGAPLANHGAGAEKRSLETVRGASVSKGELVREVLQNRMVWILSAFYFGITCGSNALNFFFRRCCNHSIWSMAYMLAW